MVRLKIVAFEAEPNIILTLPLTSIIVLLCLYLLLNQIIAGERTCSVSFGFITTVPIWLPFNVCVCSKHLLVAAADRFKQRFIPEIASH